MEIKIRPHININDYPYGVIIARMQVHELHEAHLGLINTVISNHKKVIIFLGVPRVQNTPRNPLDFITRKSMIQKVAPNAIILPLKDERSDLIWSKNIDDMIQLTLGSEKALLYGGRDSFIPYYHGKHQTVELITDVYYSGTQLRENVSKEIIASSDFRAGVIYSTYANRPTSYQTVDIAVINNENKLLLARKPGETKYRFIGGFVDVTDNSLEEAVKREFQEETGGGCEISKPIYLGSYRIDDWRYKKEKSKILTSLFFAKYVFGSITPTDDIEELQWFDIDKITIDDIMSEHQKLFNDVINHIRNRNLHKEE